VPVQIVSGSPRVQAALKLAAGPSQGGSLASGLGFICEQLATLCDAPIASIYVLEPGDELVLRGNHGYDAGVLGEVRLKVGQGITGTAVESMRPVTVDDARLIEQFSYFPQLAEERYPAFLAIPVLSSSRPRGALVLQREEGPFSERDLLLAISCTRGIAALIDAQHPQGANLLFHGSGNKRGRTLGMAAVLSRAIPRRRGDTAQKDALAAAFQATREEVHALVEKARAAASEPPRELDEITTTLDDVRLEERAQEHLKAKVGPSLALERIAAEYARALADHGPAARRAVDVEAFLGAVAHRLAGLETSRWRRGELLVGVHLPGLSALRAWSHGVIGAVCAADEGASTGVALLASLGLPVVCGVRQIFQGVGNGDRIALDSDTGEVIVNPTAAQAASWRR
jgi:phosphotransferase system enzyme I (PtsP)